VLVLLALAPLADAKKPKPPKGEDVPAPAPIAMPAPVRPPAASWVQTPGAQDLPPAGPVQGVMGGQAVVMPKVALSFHIPPKGGPKELVTTATLYLEQSFEGTGPSMGANQVWVNLPVTLGLGVTASPEPVTPPFAQLSNATDGSDARNWNTAEITWVVEITDWQVTLPAEGPAEETPCGTASGRVAVFLRDGWGGTGTGQIGGSFAALPVKCAAASY
jgi:hypothetical protein